MAKEKYIGKYFLYQNDSVGSSNAVNHELVLTVESLIAAVSAACTTTSDTTFFFLWRYSPSLGLGLPP
jgi:hypothetical protein